MTTVFFTDIFLFQLVLIFIMLWSSVLMRKKPDLNRPIKPLTVIISFRNEESRVRALINSLNNSKYLDPEKIQILFVDDNSTDSSSFIIKQELNIPFDILQLKGNHGKKGAIDLGVQNAIHAHILTLDADVSFGENYLNDVQRIKMADMNILPVEMTGKSLIQTLSLMEFNWLRLITFSSLAVKAPVLCNGANLLFRKKAYLDVKPRRNDLDIASGDDIFLLEALKKENKNIQGNSNPSLRVYTPAPDSLSKLLLQRKRWISKMFNNLSFLSTIGAIAIIFLQLLTILCIYGCFFNLWFLLPLVIKLLGEYTLQLFYSDKKEETRLLFITILHQVFYPFYLMLMLIPMKDKGRWQTSNQKESGSRYNRD